MTKLEDIQLPPNDYEIEKMWLSLITMDKSIIDSLDDDCFYWEATRKIYKSMKKTRSIDFMPLSVDSWIDVEQVMDILACFVSESSVDYVVWELIRYKNARTILKTIDRASTQARWLNVDWSLDILNQLSSSINVLWWDKTIEEYSMDYFNDIDSDKKQLSLWYKLLDEVVDIYWWQLIIIAGRPSMWKTTVMQNIAIRQSQTSKVWFISMEMKIFELIDRFVCIVWWLTSYEIKNKKQNKDKIINSLSDIVQNKIHLTENIYSLSKIHQYIVKNELDICHIDYLWLIQYWDSKMTTIHKISEITRQLKLIAKETNCAIILWCQLSRDVEKRTDKRPVLSDLRDSGTIEQDADIVIALYREEYYDANTEQKNKIDMLVRKQRNGELKTIRLDSKFSSYRIIDNWVIENPF